VTHATSTVYAAAVSPNNDSRITSTDSATNLREKTNVVWCRRGPADRSAETASTRTHALCLHNLCTSERNGRYDFWVQAHAST